MAGHPPSSIFHVPCSRSGAGASDPRDIQAWKLALAYGVTSFFFEDSSDACVRGDTDRSCHGLTSSRSPRLGWVGLDWIVLLDHWAALCCSMSGCQDARMHVSM